MSIQTFKAQFDPIFLEEMRHQVEAFSHLSEDPFLTKTSHHVLTLAASGGKRVRPYVATLGYTMLGGEICEDLLRYVSALECFHLFALVHDDIIDHGTERHGVPTLHRFAHGVLQAAARHGDLEHIGCGHAILLGDLLHAAANRMLRKGLSGMSQRRLRMALEEYDVMVQEVMIGEMVDIDSAARASVDDELVDIKMLLKTASYTFVRPLRIGAVLAGASKRILSGCDAFGTAIGLAFQIQDDYLDLTQSAKHTGKAVLTDLREQQHTVFTQYIARHGTAEQKHVLQTLLGKELTEADRPAVQTLFEVSGAFAAGEKRMNKLFDDALQALDGLKKRNVKTEALEALVQFIRERTH